MLEKDHSMKISVASLKNMKDKDKTKEHLINELSEKRQRIAELERSEAERKQAERALIKALEETEQKQKKISKLLESSRAVLEHHEFKNAAEKIFTISRNLIGAAVGCVALLSGDKDENKVLFSDSDGLPCPVNPSFPTPVNGRFAEVYSGNKTLYDNNFSADEWVGFMSEKQVAFNNVLFVPLVIKGKAAGIICLANKPGGFTDDDVSISMAFGEIASVSLLNSLTLESLEQSEQRYCSLVENAPDIVMKIDLEGIIRFINRAPQGLNKQDFIGKNILDFTSDEHRDIVQKTNERVVTKGVPASYEIHGLVPDRWYNTQVGAIVSEGRSVGLTMIARDVTRQKENESALLWDAKVNASFAELSRTLIMSRTIDEISKLVLEHSRYLTGSRFGFVGYIDPVTGHLVCPNITGDIWPACDNKDSDKKIILDEFSGLRGWVLRNKKSLLINSLADDPRSSGVPEGHIPIHRLLSVPAMIGETVVGQVSVCNSEHEYSEQDLNLIERLATLYAIAVEHRRINEELSTERDKLRSIMETMECGVTIRNLAYELIYQNRSSMDVFGDCVGEKCYSVFHGIDYICEDCPVEKAFKDGQSHTSVKKATTPQGETTYWENTATPLKDSNGKIISCLEINNNITEQRNAQEKIRNLAKFPSENPNPVLRIDSRKKILYKNEAFNLQLKVTGLTAENAFDILPEKLNALIDRALKTEQPLYLLEVNVGDKIYSYNLIPIPDQKYVNLYGRNITERKKIEQALQKAYEKLKETQEQLIHAGKMTAMGQLAAGISHELNQPLTGIKGFAQAVLEDLEEDNPLKDDLQKIIGQANRMDKIIQHVRLFARKSEFTMEKIDINQPVKDSFILLNKQLETHNVTVKNRLAKDLPLIMGDANQLEQAFINLITNARDAIDSLESPDGGEIVLESSLSRDKRYLEITFKDTGSGISENDLEHIFNPFYTTKAPNRGIGLGLSIVYRIIETHRGSIEVDSEEGKGTIFKITLPVAY